MDGRINDRVDGWMHGLTYRHILFHEFLLPSNLLVATKRLSKSACPVYDQTANQSAQILNTDKLQERFASNCDSPRVKNYQDAVINGNMEGGFAFFKDAPPNTGLQRVNTW